jgi:hypothetical protein
MQVYQKSLRERVGYVSPPEASEAAHGRHAVAGHSDVFNFASILLTLVLWQTLPMSVNTLPRLLAYIQDQTPRIEVGLGAAVPARTHARTCVCACVCVGKHGVATMPLYPRWHCRLLVMLARGLPTQVCPCMSACFVYACMHVLSLSLSLFLSVSLCVYPPVFTGP